MNEDFFTTDERKEFVALYKELKKNTKAILNLQTFVVEEI